MEEWGLPAVLFAIVLIIVLIITALAWQHAPHACQEFIDTYGRQHCIERIPG